MNHEQQLIDAYLDGELTSDDERRLTEWLTENPEHVRQFVREAHLNRQLRDVMVSRMYEVAGLVTAKRTKASSSTHGLNSLFNVGGLPWLRWPWAWVGLASCLLLTVSVWVWCFGPVVGQPVLAEILGTGLTLERGGSPLPASGGIRLQPGDVLRTSMDVTAVISFGPETTRLTLGPATHLELKAFASGKRFALTTGKLEASVAKQRPFKSMIISTPQAEARVLGTRFTLAVTNNATRLEVTQGKVGFARLSDGKHVEVSTGHYAVAASNYVLTTLPMPGKVLREVWLDLPGGTFNELIHDPRYPNAPSGRDFPESFETTTNWPSAFGTRTRAYLLPPVSGTYEFRISGNGQFCLWMSPDDNPLEKVRIGQLFLTRNGPGDLPPEETTSRQESGPIPLTAGRSYYIEAVHKYGTGKDRLSVTWKRPDGTTEPIPPTSLGPFVPKKGAKK